MTANACTPVGPDSRWLHRSGSPRAESRHSLRRAPVTEHMAQPCWKTPVLPKTCAPPPPVRFYKQSPFPLSSPSEIHSGFQETFALPSPHPLPATVHLLDVHTRIDAAQICCSKPVCVEALSSGPRSRCARHGPPGPPFRKDWTGLRLSVQSFFCRTGSPLTALDETDHGRPRVTAIYLCSKLYKLLPLITNSVPSSTIR